MMPYGRFLAAAEEHRYDIDRLCAGFGVSVEQVAHRLTTLGRTGARGIPFFMLRVDRGRQHLQALRRRGLSLLALRRHLPALEPARRLPDAGPDRHPDRRDARRPALLHHRPHRRARVRLDPREDSQLAIGLGCDVQPSPRSWPTPTASTSPSRRSPRSAPPARSARASAAPQRAAPPAGRTLAVDTREDDLALPVRRRLSSEQQRREPNVRSARLARELGFRNVVGRLRGPADDHGSGHRDRKHDYAAGGGHDAGCLRQSCLERSHHPKTRGMVRCCTNSAGDANLLNGRRPAMGRLRASGAALQSVESAQFLPDRGSLSGYA